MVEKPLVWVGSSLEDLRDFPAEARRLAGYQLRRVQSGRMPSEWKPMKTIGPGVNEIRIHAGIECRVFYLARLPEAIYVLHAFEKRTRQTPRGDIDLARRRFVELRMLRTKRKER